MELYKELCSCEKFFLIAGPCVVEDEKLMMQIAAELVEITQKWGIPFIFKSSFKKANRTSIDSPTGPGVKKGLEILSKIKKEFNIPILTDIHEISEVEEAAEVVDILQIPAFLSRQSDLILAAAKTGRIVNIKKGQFMAPEDIENAANKVLAAENINILLTERGTSFGYHNLVVDFRSFAIMKQLGYPIIYDVTHSLQKPSINKTSGGTPQYIEMMAKAALATGKVDGLFIETHPNPAEALSDASSMLPLIELPKLLDACLKIKG
ncbi:MAG: 3-deoxy-8-phosphooctulonate synthase [Candidatus Cloacimonadota bacterium]|nr:3-deoxy-8-phosphooctulonate synthase [Candidatus Cloacimonadota bacterium]